MQFKRVTFKTKTGDNMTEQQTREFKLPEKRRIYEANQKRKQRIKNKKCSCGRQAFAKVLITQELKCNRCMVAILKEDLLKNQKKED